MNINEWLKTFEYSQDWLDYGVLSESHLLAQVADYQKSGHSCFEHYRYGAFNKWIRETPKATNQDIQNYIKLALTDPDQIMGHSAIVDLLKVDWLSDNQFEMVSETLRSLGDWAEQEIEKNSLRRMVIKPNITSSETDKLLNCTYCQIQIKLFNRSDLSIGSLQHLAENGSSKKIRHLAKERLKKNAT